MLVSGTFAVEMANTILVCKCQDIVVKDTEKKTYEGSRAEDAKDCKMTQNDIRLLYNHVQSDIGKHTENSPVPRWRFP